MLVVELAGAGAAGAAGVEELEDSLVAGFTLGVGVADGSLDLRLSFL